jgi:hypothetical protein
MKHLVQEAEDYAKTVTSTVMFTRSVIFFYFAIKKAVAEGSLASYDLTEDGLIDLFTSAIKGTKGLPSILSLMDIKLSKLD